MEDAFDDVGCHATYDALPAAAADDDDWVGQEVSQLDWQRGDTAKGQEWPSRDLKRIFFNQEVF